MATTSEIRQYLGQWLDGKITLHQFEDWFVPQAGSIHAENRPHAESLIDDIDMALSEYSDGVLSAKQLREDLTRIARPFALSTMTVFLSENPQESTIAQVERIGPRSEWRSHPRSAWGAREILLTESAA